eukprot:scaffold680_cov264-Pinguiococcus_pyrenoidosus.AAC.7
MLAVQVCEESGVQKVPEVLKGLQIQLVDVLEKLVHDGAASERTGRVVALLAQEAPEAFRVAAKEQKLQHQVCSAA